MAAQLGAQYRPPFFGLAGVPDCFEPYLHVSAFRPEFLRAGLAANDEFTPPAGAAVMGKAQKVKGVASALLPLRVLLFRSEEHTSELQSH